MVPRGYNPVELGRNVEGIVCRDIDDTTYRKYYRFRGGKWYGGIATADCVGCNLRCGFCWSWKNGSHVIDVGKFYAAQEVSNIILSIARNRGYSYVRISGGEPTLCFNHLLEVISNIPQEVIFILETNGILLGYDKNLVYRLAERKNVIIRVSLKGASPEEFYLLTKAEPAFFEYQLNSLKNLLDAGLEPGKDFYPAVMLSFSSEDNIKSLLNRLAEIHPQLVESIDPEYVILYPHVKELLKKMGLKPRKAFEPSNIPKYMV